MEFVLPGPIRRNFNPNNVIFEDYFERTLIGNNWDISALESASIIDNKLVTEQKPNTYTLEQGAKYTGNLNLNNDFKIEASLEWISRTSDLGRVGVGVFDESDNRLAYGGIHDGQASQNPGYQVIIDGDPDISWFSGYDTRPFSGSVIIKIIRIDNYLYLYENDTLRLSGIMNSTVKYIILINSRYQSYSGKTAKWNYIKVTNS